MSKKLLRLYIRESIRSTSSLDPHEKGDDVTISIDDPVMSKIEDALADMAKKSYAFMGGWSEIETPKGLKNKFTHFFVSDVDEDPEPDVGIYYTDWKGSQKASALVTDGSPEGKAKLRDMMVKFFSRPGSWIEVSGAPANILISKLGLPTIESEKEVRSLLSRLPQDDIVFNGSHPDPSVKYGRGWYTRTIGSHRVTKIIVGNP